MLLKSLQLLRQRATLVTDPSAGVRRLLYRAKNRGTLELDKVFTPFSQKYLSENRTEEEIEAFTDLLNWPDVDVQAIILKEKIPTVEQSQNVAFIELINWANNRQYSDILKEA